MMLMDTDIISNKADIIFTNLLNKDDNHCNANLLQIGDLTMLLDCGCDEMY